MKEPTCTRHDRLVLDLALGKLGDTDAARAEAARRECHRCRDWWAEHLEGDSLEAVDAAVAEAFSTITLPARRTRRTWLAAAAIAVLALGAGTLWRADRQLDVASSSTTPAIEAHELSGRATPNAVPEAANASALETGALVFASGFESGHLTGWSSSS